MQVARNSLAFCEPLFQSRLHTCRDLPEAKPKQCPEQKYEDGAAEESKPYGLIIGGQDREGHSGAGVIPYSIVVAGDDVKPIATRAQARYRKLDADLVDPASLDRILPIGSGSVLFEEPPS